MGHPLSGLPVPMAPVQGRRTERAPRHGSRSEQRCPTHQGRPRLSGGGIPRAASRAHVDTGPGVHRAQALGRRPCFRRSRQESWPGQLRGCVCVRTAWPHLAGGLSALTSEAWPLAGHTGDVLFKTDWPGARHPTAPHAPGPECHTGTPPGPHCRPQASRCTDTAFNSEDPREGSTLATPQWQTLWEGVGQERGQLRSPGTRQACVHLEPH